MGGIDLVLLILAALALLSAIGWGVCRLGVRAQRRRLARERDDFARRLEADLGEGGRQLVQRLRAGGVL